MPFSGGRKLHLDEITYCEVMLESRTETHVHVDCAGTRSSWRLMFTRCSAEAASYHILTKIKRDQSLEVATLNACI